MKHKKHCGRHKWHQDKKERQIKRLKKENAILKRECEIYKNQLITLALSWLESYEKQKEDLKSNRKIIGDYIRLHNET